MLCDCKMVVGERGAIYLVHRPVHHAVHLNGQRNCHEKRRMRKTERTTLYLPKGLNWAGATRHFAARCVTWSAGSLQPCTAPLGDEFRPRTGEERESTKLGFHMAPVKKVINSVSTSVCTQSVTRRTSYQRILNGFETAKPKSSGVRTTEMGGSDPTAPQNRGPIPSGFGGRSRLLLRKDAAPVLAGRMRESEKS